MSPKTYWNSISDFDAVLTRLSKRRHEAVGRFLADLELDEAKALADSWPFMARASQKIDIDSERTALLLGGRGAGKTRAGAEWVRGIALNDPHYAGDSGGRLALVGESYDEVRDVMIEGHSGLLSVHKLHERPAWSVARRRLEWRNGVIGEVFSANDPDGLRGSQFGAVWCDEMAKWPYLDTTWDTLQFCLRLGQNPKQVITTTPKPLALLKRLIKDPTVKVLRSTTRDNIDNLAPGFVEYLESQYGNTRQGRQELEGELIEDREDALWSRVMLEQSRISKSPDLQRIVVAVDPPVTSNRLSDACGIVVAGVDGAGRCFVLQDATLEKATPHQWAIKTISVFHKMNADLIVAETNQGGDMVKTMLANVDATVPVRSVHASRGKYLRAEPVAMLYERGQVVHVGMFAALEDQMCDFGTGGLSSGKSPDRLDALVWAITELALQKRGQPRVRRT